MDTKCGWDTHYQY